MHKKFLVKNNMLKLCLYIILATYIINILLICFFIDMDNNKSIEVSNSEFNFTYLISEFQTEYNEQNINRSTNIKIASDKINNIILLPGEIFSFNTTVGNRNEESGFKIATVYQNGKITEGFGGGVCQVSTTLYNAVLYANLMVIERKGHLFLPSYISAGRDATVADEYIDFKFKNTRKNPIKIVSEVYNGILKIKIYGTRQNDEYKVEIQSVNKEIVSYETIREEDNNIEKGTEIIIQKRKKWL